MEIALIIILFIIGLILIIKGGDLFVDAAAWIAEVSGIPKVIVGATIVSLATTLPEIIVSLIAAVKGQADMAIGNAVGSVTANIGLILGIGAVCMPFIIKRKDYIMKGILMIGAITVLYLGSANGSLNIFGSIVLLCIFTFFIYENVSSAKKILKNQPKEEKEHISGKTVILNIVKFITGTAGIVIGADLLVDNGGEIARIMGVPESIIAVTLVAIGTSLPELVTMITSVVKKQGALSVGNIIGANIIDTTLIVPLCGIVSGSALETSKQSLVLDMPFCILVSAFSIISLLASKKLARWQGVTLLFIYIVYLALLITLKF